MPETFQPFPIKYTYKHKPFKQFTANPFNFPIPLSLYRVCLRQFTQVFNILSRLFGLYFVLPVRYRCTVYWDRSMKTFLPAIQIVVVVVAIVFLVVWLFSVAFPADSALFDSDCFFLAVHIFRALSARLLCVPGIYLRYKSGICIGRFQVHRPVLRNFPRGVCLLSLRCQEVKLQICLFISHDFWEFLFTK